MKNNGHNAFTLVELPAVSGRKTAIRGFTLVELLVVIGIMAVLIAFALPSFIGIGRGSKMNAGLLQVRSTLTLARQWAITHREVTYVVFPQYDNDTNKAYRAFIVYGANSGYVSQWNYLPDGIVITSTSDIYTSTNVVELAGLSGLAGTVRAVQFRTDGRGKGGGSAVNILLTEGWLRPGSSGVGTTDSKPNGYTNELEISGLTGIAKYIQPW